MRDTFENLGTCVVVGKIRPTKENVRFSNPGPEKGAINVRHVLQNLKTPLPQKNVRSDINFE